MKKVLKITGVILGVIVLAVLIVFIFFPGLPAYIKVKFTYDNIDRTITEFEKVYIPESFNAYNIEGVSVRVPFDYEPAGTGKQLKASDGEGVVAIIKHDSLETKRLLEKYADSDSDIITDPWEYYAYEKEDYEHYFSTVGEEFPNDYNASSDILWYIKGRLTAKDCLKLRGRDMDVFLELAESKESSWDMENAWKISGEDFIAYAAENITGDYDVNFWTVTIYPESSKTVNYFCIIRGADDDVTKQILSSISLQED